MQDQLFGAFPLLNDFVGCNTKGNRDGEEDLDGKEDGDDEEDGDGD
jgi:hypothetical protein